ncbi:hypothetical protein DRW41_20325 [Neobacillus piezotolerans]|uniref:Uncharacterized protein n=1 Tax=Neobacillus piezotolerans TaxID=2259171 RepID=A0A3D8GLJ0_9BACI|nr:hypothetical protein [Neobacillus piezotolerans]RDU34966.1 hypothetical protein DRW41_20325 [Neobacillus piezotolerans]
MEAFILIGTFMFIMGSLVLLLSGIISFFFPRVHFLYILGISGLAGLVFGIFLELGGLAFFAAVFNVFLSGIAIGLAKYGLYLKSKTDFEAERLFN